jgi:hypothetical protein
MLGLSTAVIATYGAALAGAPLILFVPPPLRVASHVKVVCRVAIRLAAALSAVGAVLIGFGIWEPGLMLGGMALTTLMLMFWAASEPRRRRRSDEDDDGSNGGGGPRLPSDPGDGDGPSGLDVDWGEFDRQRAGWHQAPAPART